VISPEAKLPARPVPARQHALVVADCAVDPAFLHTLGEQLDAAVEVLSYDTTGRRRSQTAFRHGSYLLLACRTILRGGRHQHVIFWQEFVGLYYSLLSKLLFRERHGFTTVLHLIYRQRTGQRGKIFRRLFSAFLRSDCIDAFVCHSSGERAAYLDEFGHDLAAKIHFVTYGIGGEEDARPAQCVSGNEGYFFAGGTSNRDYRTLVQAFAGRTERLKILCFERDIADLTIPPNVEVITGAFGDQFRLAMSRAKGVIVTLADPDISSGHLVLLDAMRQGKAIITTRGACTEDLLDETCAILVRPRAPEDIAQAIEALTSDRELVAELGAKARQRYLSGLTVSQYAERIARTIAAAAALTSPG
jgi:glycosyltransferase involved in cell wall biosynthesis